MHVLVTGAAGFIGFHTARVLLERGDTVIGLDNINDYYDPRLKHARLEQLDASAGFEFVHGERDISQLRHEVGRGGPSERFDPMHRAPPEPATISRFVANVTKSSILGESQIALSNQTCSIGSYGLFLQHAVAVKPKLVSPAINVIEEAP